MAGEITSRAVSVGASVAPAASSAQSSRMRETHPFAQGHCSPCDSMFAELNTAKGSIQANIPRPAGAPEGPAKTGEERREPGAPRPGDVVRLSPQGRVEGDAAASGRAEPAATYSVPKGKGPPGALRSRGPSASKDEVDRQLTEEELARVQDLKLRDAEVRAHEQAHKSAAGQHAGAISLTYQTGPDGRRYAVGGEVPVDLSPVRGDPAATLQKMQTIQRAALAPAEPSGADRAAAARAAQQASKAQAELAEVTAKKFEEARGAAQPKSEQAEGAESEPSASATSPAASAPMALAARSGLSAYA